MCVIDWLDEGGEGGEGRRGRGRGRGEGERGRKGRGGRERGGGRGGEREGDLHTLLMAGMRSSGTAKLLCMRMSGHAADWSTSVEKLIGRDIPIACRWSWNSDMVPELSFMSTTIRWSRVVYS